MGKRTRSIALFMTLFTLAGLLALGSGLVFGQAPDQQSGPDDAGTIGSGFSYQGRLDNEGTPVSDSCDFQFSLWDQASDGSQLGFTQELSDVNIDKGLFTVELNAAGELGTFDGGARWLEIAVQCDDADYTLLSPRQALTAVPYAQSLRPGAIVRSTSGTTPLTVDNSSGSGYSLDINGSSNSSAALKVTNTSSSGTAATVDKYGGSGVGHFARNNGTTGSGAAGYSSGWFGVYGYTGTDNHNYGFYSPDNLYTRNINFSGSLMMVARNGSSDSLQAGDVAVFSGLSDGSDSEGQPIIEVGRATVDNGTAVAGVVYGGFPHDMLNAPPEGLSSPELANFDPAAPVAPGDYLLLVVYGPAQVNTGGAAAGWQPGALMTVGDLGGGPGLAVASVDTPAGAVFGKALETTANDANQITVFVTLR